MIRRHTIFIRRAVTEFQEVLLIVLYYDVTLVTY
jgi:hypothetical protein